MGSKIMRRNTKEIRSPTGTALNALSWQAEAPLRMLMNNLDPDVAEHPEELVVYGGSGVRRVIGIVTKRLFHS